MNTTTTAGRRPNSTTRYPVQSPSNESVHHAAQTRRRTAATRATATVSGISRPRIQSPYQDRAVAPLTGVQKKRLFSALDAVAAEEEWKSIIMNRWGYTALSLMLISQSLGAAKLYFFKSGVAAGALAGPAAPQAVAGSLAGYLGCWAGSELGRIANWPVLQRWRDTAYDAFINRVVALSRGQVQMWALESIRRDVERWVGPQGRGVIEQTVESVRFNARSVSAVLCEAVALSSFVTPLMAPAFASTVGFGYLYHRSTDGRRERSATAELAARNTFNATTGRMPANVMLPNQNNFELWQERQEADRASLRNRSNLRTNEMTQDHLVYLLSGAAPALGVLVNHAAAGLTEALDAFSAVPSIANLIQEYSTFMLNAGSWRTYSTQMSEMMTHVQVRGIDEWNQRLAEVEARGNDLAIFHNGQPVGFSAINANPDLLLQPGHWTVQAPNGTGKTVLLQAIARYFPRLDVSYLPPSSVGLLFPGAVDGSEGQQARARMEETAHLSPSKILLLDEWDAYLDADNRAEVRAHIQQWARDRAVISVSQIRTHN